MINAISYQNHADLVKKKTKFGLCTNPVRHIIDQGETSKMKTKYKKTNFFPFDQKTETVQTENKKKRQICSKLKRE